MHEAPLERERFAPLDAINLLYALCLTVILTLLYRFDEKTSAVESVVSGLRWLPVFLFIAYFLLDWASANLNRSFPQDSAIGLWLNMSSVPFLTITIMSLYSSSDSKFLIVSSYTLAVATWDFFFLPKIATEKGAQIIWGALLPALRASIALFMLLPALIGAFGRQDVVAHSQWWLWDLTITLVGLKILRTIYVLTAARAEAE